jgi:NAD(P)-dependent dehydrogenase (short-subunit alcohol dehydrogenase family)
MTALYAEAEKARGPVDIVVANAGMSGSSPAQRTSLGDWQRTLDVNLTGSFLTVKPALAGMTSAKSGRVVFVASTAGLKGYAYVAPYVAAKHGVVGLMRALATELVRTGVTVNAVCPGFVETDMLEESVRRIVDKTGRTVEQARASLADTNPQGRFIQPDEVAAAVLWLCSEAAKEKLRLWIRLLRASRIIEAELRERLVKEFDTTLPRFDVMAALYRTPHGMLMSDLSRFLLVSNGNVTGIVGRLVSEGLLQRGQRNGDRRTSIVQLTRTGRDAFRAMAAAHEQWVGELLAGVTKNDARQLTSMLKAFRSNWEGRE